MNNRLKTKLRLARNSSQICYCGDSHKANKRDAKREIKKQQRNKLLTEKQTPLA